MDTSTARDRLKRMTQWDVDPVLTSVEIEDLLLYARRRDANGYDPIDVWAPSTVYTIGILSGVRNEAGLSFVGTRRVPTNPGTNPYYYTVTTAGVSGSTEPTWPTTPGLTVTDGTVVWSCTARNLWTPTFYLRAAAAEGWRWKAAKVVSEIQAELGGGVAFSDNQRIEHCLLMVKQYSSGGVGSLQLTR